MKTTGRCPKCKHDRILYIDKVADRLESATTDYSAPMRVAYYKRPVGNVFGMALTSSASAGELSAGVCRLCGYTEFYTKDPQNIIVDGVNVREVIAATKP
jgi:predicted nucleic-acid-binding Zn-ribbon protein